MFRTPKGKEARHHRNTLRWHRHMLRLAQSQRSLDAQYDNANWDNCLTAHLDYPPATLIHNGRKPRVTRRHTPWS